ncbi:hypothetical protein [Nocardia sp. NPDC051570]|uniref:hypothetical protein n=1 Tax=Nocardia sp. NPDC051570 TaxID=3364324 RepID=UPI0037ABC145
MIESSTVTATEKVSTDRLRHGDVVLNHGMRLIIDQPIQTRTEDSGDTVYSTSAVVANREGITSQAAAEREAGIINGRARFIQARTETRTGTPRWTIQGNRLAHWYREVRGTAVR